MLSGCPQTRPENVPGGTPETYPRDRPETPGRGPEKDHFEQHITVKIADFECAFRGPIVPKKTRLKSQRSVQNRGWSVGLVGSVREIHLKRHFRPHISIFLFILKCHFYNTPISTNRSPLASLATDKNTEIQNPRIVLYTGVRT